MKSNLYIKDLCHQLSVKYNLGYSQAFMAVQFVFTYILSSILKSFVVKLVSFGSLKIVQRNSKETTLLNSGKKFMVPSRKILLCKFSKNLVED